ncbi:MAG: hypothetical protein IKN06_04605 [Bacteroidales bacterium]|nr:hypothetical protein [Bacteroidales bacterium]
MDATDCGPTCLRIIVAYYRVTISAEHSRKLCYNNRTGPVSSAVIFDWFVVGIP